MPRTSVITPEKFATLGEMLRFLRRKADLTQRELAIAVGYSESQISRLEKNERAPDEATLAARFVPALYIEDQPEWVARLLELGVATHSRSSGDADAPQPIAEAKPTPHNLPIQLTSFVGREREIIEIKRLLSPQSRDEGMREGAGVRARLLTLTGPGGCGKTRLALQSASGLRDVFRDGVWFVELAPLTDPLLVPQTIGAVLGVKAELGRPLLSTLTDHLRDKQTLLILDNCEHLIAAAARFAEAVLRSCPKLSLLATSREALGIAGEVSFLVPSLSSPDPVHPMPVGGLTQYEAVRLFVDRAVTALPGFTVTNENAPALAKVCRRLDGIPLAIELAAARVNLLKVEQIAERLDDRFGLLRGGSRTALPRHQTLAALIDWSYDLLTEPERILLRRLSVFAGGWTLEAAKAVGAGGGSESDEILDLLTQLVNKSLVVAEREQGEEARYRTLETIRQYSLERLTASGEAEAVRQQHASYYLTLAEAGASSISISTTAWNDRMETEHDNMQAALAWSQSAPGNAELGLQLAGALMWFWSANGLYWREGRGWLEGALAHAEEQRVDHANLRARALFSLGFLAATQGNFAAGEKHLADSLKLYQELGDVSSGAYVLSRMGWLARERGDTTMARLRLEESLTIFRKLEDKANIAEALNPLGEVLVMQEDAVGATRLLEEGLTLSRELGESNGIGWALNHLGHAAQIQGEYERATRLHEESLQLFVELGPQWLGMPWAYQGLGETALAQGRVALAATYLVEALRLFHDLGDRAGVSWCLAGLAGVAALDEEPERAAWLWGAAEALRRSIGAREAPAARATHERLKAAVLKQLGEAAFNANWAEGQAASVEQAVAEALQL